MGRPRLYDVVWEVSVSEPMAMGVDLACAERGMTRAEYLRQAIANELEREQARVRSE